MVSYDEKELQLSDLLPWKQKKNRSNLGKIFGFKYWIGVLCFLRLWIGLPRFPMMFPRCFESKNK